VQELLEQAKVPEAASLCSNEGEDLRLWPHRQGTDGFYAAAWEKAQA
jgi:16S rRNA (cytosine967-C5)-methyltransferase